MNTAQKCASGCLSLELGIWVRLLKSGEISARPYAMHMTRPPALCIVERFQAKAKGVWRRHKNCVDWGSLSFFAKALQKTGAI